MKSLPARLKVLLVWFKKHWWKIAIFSILWKIVPIIIWWHHIEQWLIDVWSWWNNKNINFQFFVYLSIFLAIGFWCFIRAAAIVSKDEEEHKE